MTNSNKRANALADRLIMGANRLVTFTEGLFDSDWNKPVVGDGRPIGVVVDHVSSVYPIEIALAQILSRGNPITEVFKEAIDKMNAEHAIDNN